MNEHSARVTLGVSSSATAGEIKRAYRQRALELHPDRGGDPIAFARLAEAQRELLSRVEQSRGAGDSEPTRASTASTPHRRSWFVASKQPVNTAGRVDHLGRPAGSTPVGRRSGRSATTTAGTPKKSFGEVLAEKLAAA